MQDKKMETSILTPKRLFQKDVRYTIPQFQRPYVWNQDNQWEPLWNDVRNVAEDYLDELEKSNDDSIMAQRNTSAHFLGAVVLKLVHTAARDFEQREVIDGQQRVTTLQLLLDAVRQTCRELHLAQPAKRIAKLVTNDRDLIGDDQDHVFKLWPTLGDRDAFRSAMDNEPSVRRHEASLLVQAHGFFKLQVRSWIEDRVHDLDHKVEAIEAAATELLQMVVIDLSPQDDPNVIFETLNARGTPLEQSDLIKNFVLSRDTESDSWGSLSENWWRKEVRQGRLLRPRVDMLLNYWLSMRTGSDVGPSRVFDAFRGYSDEHEIHEVMSVVRADLERYRQYETNQGDTPEEQLFFYRTGVMQAGVITPVLLLLLSVDEEARIRALQAIESFLVRRMVCRQTTKDYNRLTLELAVQLQKCKLKNVDRVVARFLGEQTAYARKWPSDQEVADSLESSPLYRLVTRGRLRLVLEGLEHRLRCSEKTEQADVPRNLTIEHLMPQGWRGNWLLSEAEDHATAEYERDTLIHSIGNLTLANQKLNSSMSNAPWETKRDELQDHSVLLLNRELTDKACWNEESIRARSRRMATLLSECWPGPESWKWDRGW